MSFFWWYPFCSVLTFLLYWHDKRQARCGGWRVPEFRLHLMALVGGWPGALLAQRLLRHKNRKLRFQLGFWLIGALHAVLLVLVGWGASISDVDADSPLRSLISFLY